MVTASGMAEPVTSVTVPVRYRCRFGAEAEDSGEGKGEGGWSQVSHTL
jgi:hypothetical protein